MLASLTDSRVGLVWTRWTDPCPSYPCQVDLFTTVRGLPHLLFLLCFTLCMVGAILVQYTTGDIGSAATKLLGSWRAAIAPALQELHQDPNRKMSCAELAQAPFVFFSDVRL